MNAGRPGTAPVGVLLLTHEALGQAMLQAARHVLGDLPLAVAVQEVPADAEPETALERAARAARTLDRGGGVLVLTDLYGATPCNIAHRMPELGVALRCVAGLNLPMLLRVLNYAGQPLDELAQTAARGGQAGILVDRGQAP